MLCYVLCTTITTTLEVLINPEFFTTYNLYFISQLYKKNTVSVSGWLQSTDCEQTIQMTCGSPNKKTAISAISGLLNNKIILVMVDLLKPKTIIFTKSHVHWLCFLDENLYIVLFFCECPVYKKCSNIFGFVWMCEFFQTINKYENDIFCFQT